jgi:uncharacterized protein (TIGR02145 family)
MRRKITFLALMFFVYAKLQAQDYQISFAGIGESTTIEIVQVQNLTQGTSLTLGGSDVLHLTATVTDYEQLTTIGNNLLQIYPNPMTSTSTLEFEIPQSSNVIIELFDISGKKVTSTQKSLQPGIQKFNVTGLNRGIYAVNVKSDNLVYSGKIISNSIANGKADIAFINSSINEHKAKLKSAKAIALMQYNTGDRILLKAVSGKYSTIKTLVPVASSTETFNLVAATDYDGNNYTTVTIDKQVWMVENLKVTHYRNGEEIPNVTENASWTSLTTGAYSDNKNTPSNADIYGRLYNWYTVADSRNIAPTGWHVPTDAEWTTLTTYLGGESVAGEKMKETGTTHWINISNISATNESGFTALPSGSRNFRFGTFDNLGSVGEFWSSTQFDTSYAWDRYLFSYEAYSHRSKYDKRYGFSVRLVRD